MTRRQMLSSVVAVLSAGLALRNPFSSWAVPSVPMMLAPGERVLTWETSPWNDVILELHIHRDRSVYEILCENRRFQS